MAHALAARGCMCSPNSFLLWDGVPTGMENLVAEESSRRSVNEITSYSHKKKWTVSCGLLTWLFNMSSKGIHRVISSLLTITRYTCTQSVALMYVLTVAGS